MEYCGVFFALYCGVFFAVFLYRCPLLYWISYPMLHLYRKLFCRIHLPSLRRFHFNVLFVFYAKTCIWRWYLVQNFFACFTFLELFAVLSCLYFQQLSVVHLLDICSPTSETLSPQLTMSAVDRKKSASHSPCRILEASDSSFDEFWWKFLSLRLRF